MSHLATRCLLCFTEVNYLTGNSNKLQISKVIFILRKLLEIPNDKLKEFSNAQDEIILCLNCEIEVRTIENIFKKIVDLCIELKRERARVIGTIRKSLYEYYSEHFENVQGNEEIIECRKYFNKHGLENSSFLDYFDYGIQQTNHLWGNKPSSRVHSCQPEPEPVSDGASVHVKVEIDEDEYQSESCQDSDFLNCHSPVKNEVESECESSEETATENELVSKDKTASLFTCEVCGAEYKFRQGLDKHFRRTNHKNEHDKKSKPKETEAESVQGQSTPRLPTPLSRCCKICGARYKYRQGLYKHMRLVHGKSTNQNDDGEISENQLGNEGPKESILTCNICKRNFQSVLILRKHKRMVHLFRKVRDDQKDVKIAGQFNDFWKVQVQEETEEYQSSRNDGDNEEDSADEEETMKEPYSCEICGASYKYRQGLDKHMRHGVHKNRNTSVDNEDGDGLGLETEEETYEMSGEEETKVGEKERSPKSGKSYPCEFCDAEYKWAQGLNRHMKLKHPNKKRSVIPKRGRRTVKKPIPPPELPVGPYRCEVCGNSYKYRQGLDKHKRVGVHRIKITISTKETPHQMEPQSSGVDEPNNSLTGEPPTSGVDEQNSSAGLASYSCKVCNASYKFKQGLDKHKRQTKHGREGKSVVRKLKKKAKPVFASICQCHICGKYLKRESFRKHVRLVHERQFPLKYCEICGIPKRSGYTLGQHMANIHKVGNFKCELDGKVFYRETDLKLHNQLRHSGEGRTLKYVCSQCGKEFTSPQSLKNHEHSLHSSFRESKPFKCDTCGRGFAIKKYLNRHRRTHRKVSKKSVKKDDQSVSAVPPI